MSVVHLATYLELPPRRSLQTLVHVCQMEGHLVTSVVERKVLSLASDQTAARNDLREKKKVVKRLLDLRFQSLPRALEISYKATIG